MIYAICPDCGRVTLIAAVIVEPTRMLRVGEVYVCFVCECDAQWSEQRI